MTKFINTQPTDGVPTYLGRGDPAGRFADYYPKWIGGMPAAGGGLDKKTLATFEKLKIGQKIRLTWEYDERFRAVDIEILDKSDPAPKDKN